jgi:predicted hydrolase (HD superfamily)
MDYVNREKYLAAGKEMLAGNVYNHCLALEACMGGLYDYFKANNLLSPDEPAKEDWMLAGFLHDIAYWGDTKADHPLKANEVLSKYRLTVTNTVNKIIHAHAPDITGVKPATKAEWSIFCADSLTGLITAVALILPSRKLADVKLSSVMKRLHKQPKFAAGPRREEINQCSDPNGLNLPVEKFVEICLNAMRGRAPDIGL